MKWQIQFVKNALFGLLPFPDQVRSLKRKFIPYAPGISELILEQGIQQVEMIRNTGYSLSDKVLLEIGSGWKPIIPMMFFLAGCKRILLNDSQRLLDVRLLTETARGLMVYKEKISRRLQLSCDEIEKKLVVNDEGTLEKVLKRFNMEYLAPCDITKTDLLGDSSVDVIISRAVLEHVSVEVIKKILRVCQIILKDGGVMCHVIDNSDHWEHKDKSIPRLNYLKFNKTVFQIINSFNPLDFQNRLRHYEYLNLFKESGFRIDYDGSKPDPTAFSELSKIRICNEYSHISKEELAILTSYLVVSKNSLAK